MAYCLKCGAELEPGAMFCPSCGTVQVQSRGAPQSGAAYGANTVAEPWDLTPKKHTGRKAGLIVMAVVVALAVALAVIGIGFAKGGNDQSSLIYTLVQGNLDEIYLGRYSEEYKQLIGSTESECEMVYREGLEHESDFFVYYWNIEYPTPELKSELVELYKEIYSHSRYTVGECNQLDENTYTVDLEVYPIDIMELVDIAIDVGAMDWFYERYTDDVVNAMTQEEYEDFDHVWAQGIVDLVREKLPSLDYDPPETLAVHVIRGEDGLWIIQDEDMDWIDARIIAYP